MNILDKLSQDPYEILAPDVRWRPDTQELSSISSQSMPPMVDKVRRAVKKWRDDNYPGISNTSRTLLSWWFDRSREDGRLQYYFSQREAVESVIYLHEKCKIKTKYELLPFSSGGVAPEHLDDWRRFVVKMATGSGKTKVMSLIILWSYFHKTYEDESDLSRNILLIAPNIIVLDRLYRDFNNLAIFHKDDAIPYNKYEGRDWQTDFNMRLHRQDDVRGKQATGNLYLTNIHRMYHSNETEPSAEDDDASSYFLGKQAENLRESSVDLSEVVKDSDELLIINDEAHHIHDTNLKWYEAIERIHNSMVQKNKVLSLQLDMTATPKNNTGLIFPQTIADYPLVEAIHQNVVKRPVVPDRESESKLKIRQHPKYTEQYADYIELGVKEWRKSRDEHKKGDKKAVLFIMTDNTRSCDEVAEYLQERYNDLDGKVLVIHTKENGEITERAQGKKEKELQILRENAATIDNTNNPYSAVVSVLVLREGWDVRNVTTIVGLRAYVAKSKILPEQTLGRGLRLMYDGNGEKVSVIGTPPFVEFVKEIEQEGVRLEEVRMGELSAAHAPLMIIIDRENPAKDIDALDIAVPTLSRRFDSDYEVVDNLTAEDIIVEPPVEYRKYDEKENNCDIVFRDILTGEASHTTQIRGGMANDYSNVIAYFANIIMRRFHLFSGGHYSRIYELIEAFVHTRLFGQTVQLDSTNTLRNLAEPHVCEKLIQSVTDAISNAARSESGKVRIQGELLVSNMHPFNAKRQPHHIPQKSAQNRIIGDSSLELDFAKFLDSSPNVAAFAKNYFAVGFTIDYVKTDGGISRYYPDFLVKDTDDKVWVVETKGREDENDLRKKKRLAQWRDDVCRLQSSPPVDCLWVPDKIFRQHQYSSFAALVKMFRLKTE